jgi:uroporphyrinogen decarboxylase
VAGEGSDPLGEGWEPTDRAQEGGPCLQVKGHVVRRGPGSADLELHGRWPVGEGAEAFRHDAGHRAAGCEVGDAARRERLLQPGPADLPDQGVAAQVGLEGRADERDGPEGPFPRLLASGVVEEYEPAGGELGVIDDDVCAEGEGVRGDPLRRRDLFDDDLWPQLHPAQPLDRAEELLGRIVELHSHGHVGSVFARLVGRRNRRAGDACEDRLVTTLEDPAGGMTRGPALRTGPFLAACAGRRGEHPPVWFMRQAGRSLPEYRKIREGVPMLESCRRPELVTEITLQPVRRYSVDAAIFYSDIVVPLGAVGVDLDIVPGVGPVVAEPFRTRADLDRLPPLDAADVPYVTEAVSALVRELGATPLIGFAGAPFTLASYLVEGGPSRDLTRTKALMYGAPELWRDLLARLARIAGEFLRVQVAAGASAVQLFDSWAGALSAADYRAFVQPASGAVLGAVAAFAPHVPRLHFGVGTGELLADLGAAGATVVGVDFRVPLDEAARRTGVRYVLQGNLDPALLFAPDDVLDARVRATLQAGLAAPGHVFNLGHGVPPDADPSALARVVDLVHDWTPPGG